MRPVLFLSFGALLLSVDSNAFRIPFESRNARSIKHKSLVGKLPEHTFQQLSAVGASKNGDSQSIGNVGNIRYTTNITINGKEVYVALDTGSTDLWVIPPGGIGRFNNTKIPLSLLYGDGTYGVNGTIGVSPFDFGPYHIEKQGTVALHGIPPEPKLICAPTPAFLNAGSSTIGSITDIGIHGLFGLGFELASASPINEAIQRLYGSSATWGASPLWNIFAQNPTTPNFIAIDLARTDDLEDTHGGSFDIGEYNEEYITIKNAQKLAQYPPNSGRWTTLLRGIKADGVDIAVQSQISGVPKGTAIALFDTGAPNPILTTAMRDAVYGSIKGSMYDSSLDIWFVPCLATTSIEFTIGGQQFPIHPLDLTQITWTTFGGKNYTLCTNAFYGVDNYGGSEFDILLGDAFLRNVYSVFDFGDYISNSDRLSSPYMQFLSQIDPASAASEHVKARTATLAAMGNPVLSPAQVVTMQESEASLADDAANSTGTNVKTSVDISSPDDSADSNGTTAEIKRWAPIVVALLGANLFVGMILLVLGVLGCVRRGSSKGSKGMIVSGMGNTHYVPVKARDEDGGYRDAFDVPTFPKAHS